jgi:hypothetical protein
MRKLRGTPTDSLDLLLDTLCNVFGGIILIACLLALLTRDQDGATPQLVSESHGQLLERRIEAANNEITGLKELLAELDREGDSDLRRLASERDSLKQTLDRLRQEKTQMQNQKAKQAAGAFLDPGKELTTLRLQVQQNQLELETAQSQIAATAEKQRDLTDRLLRLQGSIRDSEAKRIVKLRFPKERSKTKRASPVIVRHGQVFSVSGEFRGLAVTKPDADSIIVTPIPNEGLTIPTHTQEILALINRCNVNQTYMTIYVYPDSFDVFRELKSLLHQTGCDYGIEVIDHEIPLQFGSTGTSPSPL